MYIWLYKDTVESGVMVLLEEAEAYMKQGYVKHPDQYEEAGSLEEMSKDDLVTYASVQFGVRIDRRKNKENMIAEIEVMENGN